MRSIQSIIALAAVAFSQPMAFDVASVKPAILRPGLEGGARSRIEHTPTSLSMWNVNIEDCVQWAYGVKQAQVDGFSSQLKTGNYDIVAKTEAAVSVAQMRLMLQELLSSRFHLILRRDTTSLPVFELVVSKRGARLPPPKPVSEISPNHAAESLPRVRGGDFFFEQTTMAGFAEKLSQLRGIERPVIDRTGIPGVFDITFKSAAAALLRSDGPSLVTLLEEQLGLKLVPARATLPVLVIEQVREPTAN